MKSYITIAGAIMLGNQVNGLGSYYPYSYRVEPQVQQSISIGSLETTGDGTSVVTGNGNTINTNRGDLLVQQQPFVEQSIQIGSLSTSGQGTSVITGNGNTINTHNLQVQSALNEMYGPQRQYIVQYDGTPYVSSSYNLGNIISNGAGTQITIGDHTTSIQGRPRVESRFPSDQRFGQPYVSSDYDLGNIISNGPGGQITIGDNTRTISGSRNGGQIIIGDNTYSEQHLGLNVQNRFPSYQGMQDLSVQSLNIGGPINANGAGSSINVGPDAGYLLPKIYHDNPDSTTTVNYGQYADDVKVQQWMWASTNNVQEPRVEQWIEEAWAPRVQDRAQLRKGGDVYVVYRQ